MRFGALLVVLLLALGYPGPLGGETPSAEARPGEVTVTEISPEEARWSTHVTLRGDGFGERRGKVFIGEVEQEAVLAWTDEEIRISVNGGTPAGEEEVVIELPPEPSSQQAQDNFLDRDASGARVDAGTIRIRNYLLPEDGDSVPGALLFETGPGADADETARRHGLSSPEQLDHARPQSPLARYFRVEVEPGAERETILELAGDPSVAWAEPAFRGPEPAATPNDDLFVDQWGMDRISAPQAWDYSRGGNQAVAIVDSGVDAGHADLADDLLSQRDFTGDGVGDECGHGTHVAGIAAAVTNNDEGIAGTGWAARFRSYKVLRDDCGVSDFASDVAQAIDQAVADGVGAINLSLGAPDPCPAEVQTAIDDATASDVLVVAAAGNGGSNDPGWPANCDDTFDVAASTQNDDIWESSNYGSWVELSGPGVDILSTTTTGGPSGCASTLDYDECTGTSMAAPLVSGTAALLYRVGAGRIAAIDHLRGHADDMACFRGSGNCGAGRLNAGQAVQAQRFGTGAALAATSGDGYWLVDRPGTVPVFGDAEFHGQRSGPQAAPVSGMEGRASNGYWLVAEDGGVFAYGSAGFHGSMAGEPLDAPMSDMAKTPLGEGYWLVAEDGGVFTFGDAQFHGNRAANNDATMVDVAGNPHPEDVSLSCLLFGDQGYWLVAADGNVFDFGCAGHFGDMGSQSLDAPISGMASTPSGKGYWLVGEDGGVFTFGDASFHGSVPGCCPTSSTTKVSIAPTPSGDGYWILGDDGGVFSFGDATFHGNGI